MDLNWNLSNLYRMPVTLKRQRPHEETLSRHKRMVIFADHVRAKRRRDYAETEELSKRFCSVASLTDDSPYLSITELPVHITADRATSSSNESFYLMFKTWDVDMRIWAATDIQRIYRGWVLRRVWVNRMQQCVSTRSC